MLYGTGLAESKSINIAWACLQSISLERLAGGATTEPEMQGEVHIHCGTKKEIFSKLRKFYVMRLKGDKKKWGGLNFFHFLRIRKRTVGGGF